MYSGYPFHTYARMRRIGADRVRTKFRVVSTERVRMTFESTDVQTRRQHGDRVETTERVRREYGGCGESTQGVRTERTQYGCVVQVRTQYGRLRCSGGFAVSLFKVRQFLQWQLVRFHSDITLQEHSDKEDVANK